MTTFALVHGGYHGARCWEHLTPLLEKAGHDVVVMDLPLEDSSATFDTYAAIVCAAIADCDDDVVLLNRLRPQSVYPALQPCSLAEFPTVKTTYVVCSDDQMLRPEWSRRTVRERIDAELIELPGDHSPFYSRPSALADVLLGLAN
jgi:hypothetical protein